MVFFPKRGAFIPPEGWFYPPKGMVLSPYKVGMGGFKGGFIPPFFRWFYARDRNASRLSKNHRQVHAVPIVCSRQGPRYAS